jgi:periplasmic mercuric ion binding protein
MKILSLLIMSITFLTACNENTNSIANATANFKVWGNCNMCKETIEGSLKVDGVSKADWNPETKRIEVSFDSTKINLDIMQKRIADVGYDNEKYSGNDQTYASLPDCCQYERKPQN